MSAWHEITRTDEYQSLPDEAKADLKTQWYAKNLAPDVASDPDLNEVGQRKVYEWFMNQPDDTGQGLVSSTASAGARGFAEVLPGSVEGLGALTGYDPLVEYGRKMRSGIESVAPVNPIYQESIPVKLGGVAGQVGSVLATGGAGGLVSRGLSAARIAEGATAAEQALLASKALETGAKGTLYGTAGLQGAAAGGQEAERYGMDPTNKYLRILAGAATELGSEMLPFGAVTETSAARRLLGGAADRAPGIRASALTEGAEEVAAQVGGNVATSGLAPEGVETPGALEGSLEAGLLGAAGGAGFGALNRLTSPNVPATPRDQAIDLEFGGQALPPSPELGLTVQARVEQEPQKMADNATKQAEAAQAPALAATIAEVTAVPTAEPQTTAVPTAEPLPVAEEALPPLGEEILPQPEAPVAAEFSPVTAPTETPSSTANAAGGSQSVQTEPAEGSIPAVTTGNVLPPAEVSSAETQVTPAQEVLGMEPAELRQPNLQPTTPDALQIERPAEVSLRQTPADSEGVLGGNAQGEEVAGTRQAQVQQEEVALGISDQQRFDAIKSKKPSQRTDEEIEFANAFSKEQKNRLAQTQAGPPTRAGFLSGNSATTQGKLKSALAKQITHNGLKTTVGDLVESLFNRGWRMAIDARGNRQFTDGQEALGTTGIGKVGINYADYLSSKPELVSSQAAQVAPTPSPKTTSSDEAQHTKYLQGVKESQMPFIEEEGSLIKKRYEDALGRKLTSEEIWDLAVAIDGINRAKGTHVHLQDILDFAPTQQIQEADSAIATLTDDEPPVMSSQRSRTAAGRKAAIQSLSGHLGEEVSVGASAEDSINAVTALQGSIPGVEKSWTGTRAEFLEDEALGKAFPDLRAALLAKDGDRVEGLFEHGRAFVITDQVIVFEGDVETAKREDITPEQAAVQRVITHESLVHRGFYALDKGTRAALFRWGAQNIYEAEMDQMAEDYGIKGDWVTDQRTREYLMEEIIARKVERLKAPPKSGPMKRLWDILERLWRRLSGQGEKPATLKDIQDVAKLLRTGLQLAENNVETRNGEGIAVDEVPEKGTLVQESRVPRFSSPLGATLSDTAKTVRRMTEGEPENPVDLLARYRETMQGSPSAMVSLDDLFASAQRENPALTPAQFGEQLQALYNDNGAYLEPAGSAAALSASAEKYNVRNAQGIPATYVMVPDPMPVKASMRLPSATAQKLNGTIRSAQEASGDLTESLQTPIVGRKVHIFPGQAFEARLDAAKQVIDALQANGVSDADMVDAINDPKLHRELGIEQDADMLGLLFAEAMVRDIPKAFDAYEVVRERAGRALRSGAQLHSHKRFAHLFLVNGALKQIRQQAEDATKAQANISGDETAKLDKDSRNITSKETQESAEEEMFRLGEEALSKANQTLWQKLKNVVQRLGAATRIFAAKNAAQKPKASLQGVTSDKEMAELEAMSPDELQAEIDKLQAEFSMLAKQMLGTTKKPRAAKGKADTGEGELTNAATARIIAQMAERMGAPVDTATAVAALTPEVGTLKAQFEKGIVSALVNKVKAAVTPKAPTGANLNSVMAQITKILADNLNLPENAPAKATLADRALDAFSRTRTNDQTIREVWEAARGKIRELLTQRATEAAGEKITAEEAAAIEAQVEEQLAAIASEVPERMWAKGQAYGVIRDALRELGYDTRAKVLAEPAVARQAVVDKINSEVAKLPDVDAARWQANQSYLLASIDALIADMQASKARADARSRGEKRKSTFSAADSKTFAAIMENARQRSGDTVPLMPESSTWTKIFSSSPQSQEDKAASMLAYMKEDPALSQLTDEEQEKLSEMFSKTWEAKRKALLEAKVASVLKRREATEKGKQAVKDSIPKLIQAINRGELTDDVLNAEIAEKFGFEKLTEKEIATIERLSKELQQPDLPTHERVGKMDEMAKIVAAKTRMSKAEILSAWWTTSVLSGSKTAFTILLAFQSGLFEVLSNAVATVARSYYQGKLTDGLNAAKQSITNYFKTFPKAMQLMWQYVVTRDKRLLSQADPAYTQYFDSGQNSPVSVGWKLRQDKRPLVREAGRFMYFVERLLTALDLFNSVTTQQGMLAMAYQLNEKTYDAARVASLTDLENYRKKAINLYWGEGEPTDSKGQALLTRQALNLLEAELAKFANVLEDSNYTAAQAAMTLTPEGAGGWLYQIIRGAATRQEIAAEKAVREAEQLTGVSPLAKATSKQLAYARRLAVHQMLNLTGLRFARFAGNKLNQSIGFLPLIGLLRLREQTYAGKMKQQAIWRNQSIGTTLAVLGVYMLKAIADEPDDEKRGWGIEGSHENLDRAKANELLTAGKPPYSLTLFGVTFNYANWPISSVLAALGAMSDRIKYDPKRWKEMSTGTRAGAAVWAGLSATLGVSALSQLSEIIGASPYSRDPLEAGLGKVSRVLGNFVGGAIPRLLKDLDAMAPGGAELRKYEGWERFGKEMPVYRRFIGAPMLDIFGKPVEKQPYPWSREYQTAPVEPEYKLLGQLASKGVFPTPADPDHRRVGKGKRSREMTDVEKKRFITNVGEGYRQLMLRHGERLTKMDTEAAKDLLGKLTAKARDRAEWQAVHPATETAP